MHQHALGGLAHVDYADWNQRIFDARIATRRDPQTRVFLYLDPLILADIVGVEDADRAVEHFAQAVRQWDRDPFDRAYRDAAKWRKNEWHGTPPLVGVLALTVLAVTMKPIGAAHSVYPRLNQLLNLPVETGAPLTYETNVPLLWRIWNEWLTGPGAVHGRPSAAPSDHYTYQGWARSQGLIRQRHRELIEDFFESIRIGDSSPVSQEMLSASFGQWLHYRGLRGREMLQNCADPQFQAILDEVLVDEAAAWTGGPRSRERGMAARALLAFDDFQDSFEKLLPYSASLRGRTLDLGFGPQAIEDDRPYLDVAFIEDDEHILRDGAVLRISATESVRVGGEAVYLFALDAALGLLVEVRGNAAADTYDILANSDATQRIAKTLDEYGYAPNLEAGPIEGWTWIRDVRAFPSPDEQLTTTLWQLGLGLLAPRQVHAAQLIGGLSVGPGLYLTGDEPDVLVPQEVDVVLLDGTEVRRNQDGTVFRLALEMPASGQHVVMAGAARLEFTTTSRVHSAAKASAVHWEYDGHMRVFRLKPRQEQPSLSLITVAGASISGPRTPSEPLFIRRLQSDRVLAIHASGAVDELVQAPESWLERLDVQTFTVADLGRAVRTLPDGISAIALWDQQRRKVRCFAVPAESAQSPGTLRRRAVGEGISELLLSDWFSHGLDIAPIKASILEYSRAHPETPTLPPAPSRRQIIQKKAQALMRPAVASVVRPLEQAPTPRMVRSGLPTNPFDDVLAWLSELEANEASMQAFAEAWRWTCSVRERPRLARDYRAAMWRLQELGCVELDWQRRRVCLSPAVLLALPAADGLRLLTGARPPQVIERVLEPDDPALAHMLQSLAPPIDRTILDDQGDPAAPTMWFFECDPSDAAKEEQQDAFATLGIQFAGCTSDELLRIFPTIQETVWCAERLDISPSSKIEKPTQRSANAIERDIWVTTTSDAEVGLYRYRVRTGIVHAWRHSKSGQLHKVDQVTGFWIHQLRARRRQLIRHHAMLRVLFVPVGAPLHPLLRRALVLRTGLPSRIATAPSSARMRSNPEIALGEEVDFLVFENVGSETANLVAAILCQELVTVHGDMGWLWS